MITRSMFADLQPGVNELNKEAGERKQQEAKADQAQQLEKLKAYLQQSGQDHNRQANSDAAQDLFDKNQGSGGGSANVSDTGASIGAKEFNPAAQMQRFQMQNQKNENDAYKNAANHYQTEASKGNESIGALKSGLTALQSNDASSPGQLNAAYLLANGFKRYNPQEASALNPQGMQTNVAEMLSKAGFDPQGQTMSDTSRANFVRFANGKLDDLQDMHNTLKSQAQNLYSNSQFSDPNKAANLGNALGGPIDSQLQSLKGQFDKFHSQAIPSSAAQGDNSSSGGLKGLLGKLWNGGGDSGQQQQAPQQAAPQQAPAPGGFDPDSFLKGQ